MRNLLTLIISLVCFNAFSQETITVAQAKDFVGKEVFLTGKVAGTKPMTSKVGNPLLLLDIDKVYPDNEMTIVIFHEVLEKGKFTEATLQNKSVKVKGIISMYKERLEIIVRDEADLMIL